MNKLQQRGIGHVLLILAIAVVAAVGLVGYRVVNSSNSDNYLPAAKTSRQPKTIKSASDVRQADRALDSTAIDSQVNPGSLDSEITKLL